MAWGKDGIFTETLFEVDVFRDYTVLNQDYKS
jgi:hypothetical protein